MNVECERCNNPKMNKYGNTWIDTYYCRNCHAVKIMFKQNGTVRKFVEVTQ